VDTRQRRDAERQFGRVKRRTPASRCVRSQAPWTAHPGQRVRRCLLVSHVEPVDAQRRWNSNLHAFETLVEAVPLDAQRGLDVGCGEGETARRLRTRVASVVGLDRDEACIAEARHHGGDISYIVGELEHVDLPENGFDVVTAVAVLHHMDQQAALCRLARLVAPGGVLLVVGLAKSRTVTDYAYDIRDAIAVRRHTLTKAVWHTPAPIVWPPPLSWADTRRASLGVLPTASFRRIPYFRYRLTWVKPQNPESP
jgi:2-polyprenyl-3-methyl-5-hydroxy-6-metoxy-1,4-benzoquinol methylase